MAFKIMAVAVVAVFPCQAQRKSSPAERMREAGADALVSKTGSTDENLRALACRTAPILPGSRPGEAPKGVRMQLRPRAVPIHERLPGPFFLRFAHEVP
jgi:hypothetical protein